MSKGFSLGITEEDLEKSGGGASFIGTSGVYDVTVNAVTVDENEHGTITLGFFVELENGKTQMLYGALPLSTYDNQTVLTGNRKAFGGLCQLADRDVAGKFNPVEASLPIGKAGAMKDVLMLDDIVDVPVKMWVKQEFYRKGDGSIGDKRVAVRFYRQSDNADGSEIKHPEKIGERFAKDEKYHTDVKYTDVTAAEAEAYLKGRSGKSDAGTTATPTVEVKKSRFAK